MVGDDYVQEMFSCVHVGEEFVKLTHGLKGNMQQVWIIKIADNSIPLNVWKDLKMWLIKKLNTNYFQKKF